MSYYLLAVELLLTCLLWTAWEMVFGLRRKRRIVAAVGTVLGVLLPLIPLLVLLFIAGGLWMFMRIRTAALPVSIALLVCYVVGAAIIWVAARRKDESGIRCGVMRPLPRITASLIFVVSLMVMTGWNIALQAKIDIQAVRSKAGAIAYSVIPPEIPDAENAAPLYQEALVQFKAATVDADGPVDYRTLATPSPQVNAYLERQAKTLDLIRRAADLPGFRLNDDYLKPDTTVLVGQLGQFRVGSNLLAAAANAEAADGDVDQAIADCRRIYMVGGHAASAPLLISALVSVAVDGVGSQTVARILPAVTKKQQLEQFAPLDPESLSRMYERSLRGEEAYSQASFCDAGSGPADAAISGFPNGGNSSIVAWIIYLQYDAPICQDAIERLETISRSPYFQTAAQRAELENEFRPENRRGLMAAIFLPSLLRPLSLLAKAQAQRSAVEMALAATHYRLDHGEYPATDDALAPAYLAAIPLDPFDGKSLRLKKGTDGSLTIYSVGEDEIDNGGDVEQGKDGKKGADVGIVLHSPPAH